MKRLSVIAKKLAQVVIPENSDIQDEAFSNCTGLSQIIIQKCKIGLQSVHCYKM